MFSVYRLTNLINNKVYIGFTSRSLKERWKSHLAASRSGSKLRLHRALKKHGPDPWKMELLCNAADERSARAQEIQNITEHNSYNFKCGYNANRGGCGGWLVPPEKYNDWLQKHRSKDCSGLSNSNALSTTNQQIVELALEFVNRYGFIPGRKRLYRYGQEVGVDIPKSFKASCRFDGNYKNLVSLVERATGTTYNPYIRDKAQKQLLSSKGKLQRWICNDRGLTKRVSLNEIDRYFANGWKRGKKWH